MRTHDYVLAHITRLFGEGEELSVVKRLLNHLSEHPKSIHLTFQLVKQLAPKTCTDLAVGRALQVLAGDHLQVLRMNFEIFDEDEISHDVSEAEVKAAMTEGINPLTGRHDPEVQAKILIYFSPQADCKANG